jgi:hypothetical protein
MLFVYKYATRFFGNPLLWIAGYLIIVNALIYLFYSNLRLREPNGTIIFVLSGTLAAIILTVVMLQFNPEQIRVGRFPALQDWITRLLNGTFPYTSPTRPSGFPFLFVLAIPFYLLGDLGFLQIFAFLAYLLLIHVRYRGQNADRFYTLILLVTAPLFLYEIAVRSDLFSNTVLVILFMGYCEGVLHKVKIPFLGLIGLVGGLLLATRGIVLLIYLIYFGFVLRNNIKRAIVFSIGLVAGFAATILPFVLWSWRNFVTAGPFAIQTSYLPSGLVVMAVAVCVYLAIRAASIADVYRYIALMLFSVVLVAFLLSIVDNGWPATVLGDRFDISYFCFALPFILLLFNYGRAGSGISLKLAS